MSKEERTQLLEEYRNLLNFCETVCQVKRSQKIKDFEAKYENDEELNLLMRRAKCMRILYIEG